MGIIQIISNASPLGTHLGQLGQYSFSPRKDPPVQAVFCTSVWGYYATLVIMQEAKKENNSAVGDAVVGVELHQERLLKTLFILIWVLTFVHMIAEYYYLYWRLPWFDIVTHFLGGIWVGLAVVWAYYLSGYVRTPTLPDRKALWLVLALGLFVGILWEGYELAVWVVSEAGIPSRYLPDTLLDICVDVVGVLVGYSVSQKVLKSK